MDLGVNKQMENHKQRTKHYDDQEDKYFADHGIIAVFKNVDNQVMSIICKSNTPNTPNTP